MNQTSPRLTDHHRAWGESQHADVFDAWRFVPTRLFASVYRSFNEIRLLDESVRACGGNASLLEVGCATGELYRYVRAAWPQVHYTGSDISQPALQRARLKYPRGRFLLTRGDPQEFADLRPDIVFCRDVVHHQPDPLGFLSSLYATARRFLVLRLRTRDRGATEWDPEHSCQFVYGSWVPYIVLNCREIIEASTRLNPSPARLMLRKHYQVLGGQHLRHLPKACYEEATGTAETAALIEKGPSTGVTQVVEEVRRDGVHGRGLRARHIIGRALASALRRALGEGYSGPTWW